MQSTTTTTCHYCGSEHAHLNVPGDDGRRWNLCPAHVFIYRMAQRH